MSLKFKFAQLLERKEASILIPFWGVTLQILITAVLGILNIKIKFPDFFNDGTSFFLFFLFPLLSFLGCYAGINYMRKNGIDILNIIGIILNLLWLTFFLLVYYLIFYAAAWL